jgi:6-phosphogluconolactonase (cycloisomerase 2 family)
MSSRVSIQQFVSNTEPLGAALGDEWYVPSTGLLYKRTAVNGTQTSWVNLAIVPSGGLSNQVLTYGTNNTLTWTPSISPTYSGIFTITNTASTVSTTTGALIVAGGAGIGGDVYVGGVVNAAQTVRTNRFIQSPYRPVAPYGLVNQGNGSVVSGNYSSVLIRNGSTFTSGIAADPTGRFVYAAANTGGGIHQLLIDQNTGAITQITTAIATGTTPQGLAVDPTGKFVYVALNGLDTVGQYRINQSTGALTSIATAITSTARPYGVAVDPSGRFLYVTNTTGASVSQYSINQSTGALTVITTAITTGANPYGVAVDPTGRFVYVTSNTDNNVSQYTINQSTGALTAITTAISSGNAPYGIAVEPTGRFVYVANTTGNSISQYSINQTTGELTTITALNVFSGNPRCIVVDPTGKFLYATFYGSGSARYYSINQFTGALTEIVSIGTVSSPYGITMDPTGRFAYVGGASAIVQYSINNFNAANAILVSPTITNPTITNYTETVNAITAGTSANIDLSLGTVVTFTISGGNATITMPTTVAGKSFVLILTQDSSARTVTWSTVAWPAGTAPTVSTGSGKKDIFSFFSDGTNWYGATIGQNY